MANLLTLIRLYQHRVDEQRLEMAKLQAAEDALHMQIASLDAQLEHERAVATADPHQAGLSFAAYLSANRKQREKKLEELAAAKLAVEAARNILQILFEDLKRAENVQEQRAMEAAAALLKAENAELDEIGAQQHQQKNKG